jgi:hypothetical protein
MRAHKTRPLNWLHPSLQTYPGQFLRVRGKSSSCTYRSRSAYGDAEPVLTGVSLDHPGWFLMNSLSLLSRADTSCHINLPARSALEGGHFFGHSNVHLAPPACARNPPAHPPTTHPHTHPHRHRQQHRFRFLRASHARRPPTPLSFVLYTDTIFCILPSPSTALFYCTTYISRQGLRAEVWQERPSVCD